MRVKSQAFLLSPLHASWSFYDSKDCISRPGRLPDPHGPSHLHPSPLLPSPHQVACPPSTLGHPVFSCSVSLASYRRPFTVRMIMSDVQPPSGHCLFSKGRNLCAGLSQGSSNRNGHTQQKARKGGSKHQISARSSCS